MDDPTPQMVLFPEKKSERNPHPKVTPSGVAEPPTTKS